MKKKRRDFGECCPICSKPYGKNRKRTRHHVFPRWWYRDGITVYACSQCHQKEFHKRFPMKYKEVWNVSECVQNWVKFCKSKGKNAYEIYPELCDLQPLY